MDGPEHVVNRNFTIYPRHKNLLDKINEENNSQALRTILDSIINGQEQAERKKKLDNIVMWSCFGGILILISYLFTFPQNMISILSGTLLFAYGTIGGVIHAISRTNRNR